MEKRPSIGVALSGGGVRGLAHLGVLKVMEEAGVPIDYLAGTSMGGIVAAVYAAGVPLDYVIPFCERLGIMDFASRGEGWKGLFGHNKLRRLLADLLGSDSLTFQDLRIPTTVVAVDIETGRLVLLNEGPLIPALLATSAFPLIFTPVRYQGRWLVDGGALNNFPVDVVRQMGADRVLGVVTPPSVTLSLDDEQRPPMPTRALFSFTTHTLDWRLPFLIAETSIGLTSRCINRVRLSRCPPDLVIEVKLPNVGTFTTGKNAEAIETGRRTALQHIAEIVRLYREPLPPRWQCKLKGLLRRLRRAWTVLREPDCQLCPLPENT